MTLTPSQKRRMQREIQEFDNEWEIRISTKEIARKKKTRIARFIDKIMNRKFKVITLYRWVCDEFDEPAFMAQSFPMKHDNIRKPKNIPNIFAMQNGWTIPEEDLKSLILGPLVSKQGEELVKQGAQLRYYWNKIWRFIVALGILLGLISSVLFLLSLLEII